MSNFNSAFNNGFFGWSLKFPSGIVVNMDYFDVNITDLPNNPATGQQFSAEGFLEYFRLNINDFADGTEFEPYCEISAICQQETILWNSNDPMGAIIKLNISPNDGVVICTDYDVNTKNISNPFYDDWKFMTIEAPYDNSHPVTGTRQFGITKNLDGSYNIYVRGVDRFTSSIQEFAAYILGGGNPFYGADNLWESFQNNIKIFVNQNGGSSSIIPPIDDNRPDWEKVQGVLMGNISSSKLGCD